MLTENQSNKTLTSINFVLLAITFLLTFGPLIQLNNSLNAILTMLVGFAFMLLHGSKALGLRNIIAFVVITWICSFSAEALGVATGYVFGQYYYTDHLGPKLLGVPLIIQVAYASMGYASFMTARLILGITKAQKSSLCFLTLIGALLMVGWDVCMDPYQSTVAGDWVWMQGGPYFGIGIHNFIGWFITVLLFMFLYYVYAAYHPEQTQEKFSKAFKSQPLIFYAIMALNLFLVPLVSGLPASMALQTNYSGTMHDLVYSMSLITFFVMGTPCFIAWARLMLDNTKA